MNSASCAGIVGALSDMLFCGCSTAASFGTSTLHHAVAKKTSQIVCLPLQLDWLRKDLEGIAEEHFSIIPKEQPWIQKLADRTWIILTSIHLLSSFFQ